jgi:hypothetical protein
MSLQASRARHTGYTLDRRIDRARSALQRISDADPAFERRVKTLVGLLARRDLAPATCLRLERPAAEVQQAGQG